VYELQSVSKTFRQGSVQINAVHEVDLEIHEHEFVVVAGPSGSGKTTLLQLLGALDRPSSGSVLFERRQRGQTVVLVTYDQTIASRAPRVVRMQDGRVLVAPVVARA
jgi:ABC-type lipoprotein export system ATPase subunit